jgi:hypothetical protein
MKVLARNHSFSEGENRKIVIQGQFGHKVSKTFSQKPSQEWWCTLVIPVFQQRSEDHDPRPAQANLQDSTCKTIWLGA